MKLQSVYYLAQDALVCRELNPLSKAEDHGPRVVTLPLLLTGPPVLVLKVLHSGNPTVQKLGELSHYRAAGNMTSPRRNHRTELEDLFKVEMKKKLERNSSGRTLKTLCLVMRKEK